MDGMGAGIIIIGGWVEIICGWGGAIGIGIDGAADTTAADTGGLTG